MKDEEDYKPEESLTVKTVEKDSRTTTTQKKLCKRLVYRVFYGDRGGIQTCNPHIRSVVLYSVELRSH